MSCKEVAALYNFLNLTTLIFKIFLHNHTYDINAYMFVYVLQPIKAYVHTL